MKDKPLIVSLLFGFIVVLVIAAVSLLVKINSLDEDYKKEVAKGMSFQKSIEDLKSENTLVKKENENLKAEKLAVDNKITNLNAQVDSMNVEMTKLKMLKDKLEENLKDELIKKDIPKADTVLPVKTGE